MRVAHTVNAVGDYFARAVRPPRLPFGINGGYFQSFFVRQGRRVHLHRRPHLFGGFPGYSAAQQCAEPVNARAAGPRLGKQMQGAIKGSKTGDWSVAEDGTVTSGGIALEEGEYSLDLVAGESAALEGRTVGVLRGGDFLALDTRVTPELEGEGTARDVVRAIQSARREAGLDISDRILLTVDGDEAVTAAVAAHRDLVAGEVLAVGLEVPAAPAEGAHAASEKVAGGAVTVSVRRA